MLEATFEKRAHGAFFGNKERYNNNSNKNNKCERQACLVDVTKLTLGDR